MVPIFVTTINEQHPELSRRKLHEVMRSSMRAMGRKWAEDLLPEHFLPSAFGAFGYADRGEKYLRRKQRMFEKGLPMRKGDPPVIAGRDTPLVLTGRLREKLLLSRFMVRAFPTRVTIDLVGPAYFTLRPRAKTTILIAREVLAVNDRHARLLGMAAERGYVEKLGEFYKSGQLKKVHRTGAA